MAGKIKGITIEIGGDTQKLNKALEDVNKKTRDVQSELRQVERLLKLDPKNTELLAQKQKLLADAVENSREKLDRLKAAQQQVNEQFAKGEISEEQYRAFQREVAKAEQELKSFEKQLRDTGITAEQVGKKMQDVGKKMTDIGKDLSMKVTAPLVAAGAASFKMAADLQDAMGATDQIFGKASDSVKKWADNLDGYYGIAEAEALEYANMMGTMLVNIGGLTEEQAAKQAATLIELAGDLTAMYGGTTADAVRALTGALKGNNTMLDNYGMAVNDAMIKTKAFEMGLYSGKGQMDLAAKQAATLALIMEQTGAAQGQAAREAEGASGSMRAFTTEIKNLATDIGEVLLPVITPLLNSLGDIVKKFSELSPKTQKTIVIIAGLAAAIGPLLLILGPVVSAIGTLVTGLGAMSTAMAGGASLVAGLTAGFPALGAAITLITGPIGIAIAAIAGLVAAGVLIYKNWDKIKETLDRVWGAIVDFFTKTIPEAIEKGLKWFSELPGKVAEFMNELPGKIGYALGVALGNIIKFGIDAINWAITEVPKFIANVIKFYMELPGKIWEQLVAALGRVREWGNNLISWARSSLPGIISYIFSFFRELPGRFLEIGKDIVRGLWNGISSMARWIRDKVSDFVGGIVSGVKGVLGIRSPSRIFMDIGENVSLGLAKGIADAKNAVDSALAGLISPQINVGLAGASPAGMGAITNTFVIQNMNVRSDQDIKLIARELYNLQQTNARGRGLR